MGSFCNAKATHIFFQQQISMYLPYFKIEILTELTTSLSFEQLGLDRYFVIYTRETTFCGFLFAYKDPSEKGSARKGNNWEQIISL